MTVRPHLGVVLTSRQLLVLLVAVTLCSDATEHGLGDWEIRRVPLGPEFRLLARRLAAARDLDPASGARLVDALDASGDLVVAVELDLAVHEARAAQVAVERMRGILAIAGHFDGLLDDDLDGVSAALQ
jgi:hypothetical protein